MLSKPEVPFLNNNQKNPKITPQNLSFRKDHWVLPPGFGCYMHGGNHLSLSVLHKTLFFVAFPVLRTPMKGTSLAFTPLVLPLVWS